MAPTRTLTLLIALALVASACGDDASSDGAAPGGDDGATPAPVDLVSAERAAPAPDDDPTVAATAVTAFGADLHRTLGESVAPDQNLVTSPMSVAIALGMLEPGADGEAQQQLRTALHITDADTHHRSMNALEQDLEARVPDEAPPDQDPGELELSVANEAYLQQGYPFEADYLDTIGRHYGAALHAVDFAADPDAVAEQINASVAETTRDRIPELVPEGTIDPATVLALVNALYLKASWQTAFEPTATAPGPFTLTDGTEIEVPRMEGFSDSSASGDGWIAATKALTGGLVVQFVLPDEGRFAEVESSLDTVFATYDEIRAPGASLSVPRFETRVNTTLDNPLQTLGITDVYEPGNLLGVAPDERLLVDTVLHETFLAVDETGVEAAAATLVLAMATSAPVDPPTPVVLDRPFLFRILDERTDATLFLGRIADPTV